MDRIYEDVKNMLCKELEEIGRKGELTSNNLEVMYKSVDIVKDLYVIDAMQHEGYSYDYSNEYSETYRPRYMYDGHPQNSYDNRGRGSHADRDSMGRYSSDYSREGYSRDESDLQAMMNRATDPHEKEVLRKALDSMRR
jgi:hypothetical protein